MLNPREFKAIFDVMCWLIPNIVWTSAETFFGHLWQPLRVVSVKTGQRNQRRFSEKSRGPGEQRKRILLVVAMLMYCDSASGAS
jgi:hypothetical protein